MIYRWFIDLFVLILYELYKTSILRPLFRDTKIYILIDFFVLSIMENRKIEVSPLTWHLTKGQDKSFAWKGQDKKGEEDLLKEYIINLTSQTSVTFPRNVWQNVVLLG